MTEPSASAADPQNTSPPERKPLIYLVAMDRQTKATYTQASTDAVDAFTKRGEDFHGEISRYRPEPGCDQLPPVNRHPCLHAGQMMDDVVEAWSKQVNTASAKAVSDLHPDAKCDLVDPETGAVLIKDVALPALLAYEASLTKLRDYMRKVPTLPGPATWHPEANEDGVYSSELMHEADRETRPHAVVGLAGNENHEPVVKWFERPTVVGTWETTHLSTALPPEKVRTYIQRIDALIQAVREGIHMTNASVSVELRNDGDVLARHVFQ